MRGRARPPQAGHHASANAANAGVALDCTGDSGPNASYKDMPVCTACPSGWMTDAAGEADCDNCLAGKYSVGPGATACEECTAGTYNDLPNQYSCIYCPGGRYPWAALAGVSPHSDFVLRNSDVKLDLSLEFPNRRGNWALLTRESTLRMYD